MNVATGQAEQASDAPLSVAAISPNPPALFKFMKGTLDGSDRAPGPPRDFGVCQVDRVPVLPEPAQSAMTNAKDLVGAGSVRSLHEGSGRT